MIPTYKLIIIGDFGCGKSSFLEGHLSGKFETDYNPTIGVVVKQLTFNTNIGKITFNTWDISGAEKFKPIRDGYYIAAQCAIIMFDITNKESYNNVGKWYDELVHVTERIPIVLCGNKVDIKDRIVKPSHINYHRRKNIDYFDVSAKSKYNSYKPFLKLIQYLTGNKDVCFIDDQNPTIPTPVNNNIFSAIEQSPISSNMTVNNSTFAPIPTTTSTTTATLNQQFNITSVFDKGINAPFINTFSPTPVLKKNFSFANPIKLALLGDMNVGKSTLAQLQFNGTFQENHKPTNGVEVKSITFKTNVGDVTFDTWDISGDTKYLYIRDGWYIGTKCAIIMFDVTNKTSYDNVGKWYDGLVHVTEKIPIVLCGNKIDVKDRIVQPSDINYHRRKNISYNDVSTKSNYNVGKPFLKLIQLLADDPNICFVDQNGEPLITMDPLATIPQDKNNNGDQSKTLAEPSIIPIEYFDTGSLNKQFAATHFGGN